MKVSKDKKQAIILYILDKICSGSKSVSKEVSEAFGMSPNTVHTYLNELIGDDIIVTVIATGFDQNEDLLDNRMIEQVIDMKETPVSTQDSRDDDDLYDIPDFLKNRRNL